MRLSACCWPKTTSSIQSLPMRMLERLGCRVDVASNGHEALIMVQSIPFEIVFMDCQMPEMDGFEATRAIRAWERLRASAIAGGAIADHRAHRERDAGRPRALPRCGHERLHHKAAEPRRPRARPRSDQAQADELAGTDRCRSRYQTLPQVEGVAAMTRSCRSGFGPSSSPFSCLLLALPLASSAATPVHQLRIYEIFDNNKQAFHDRFRDHAMRIMKKVRLQHRRDVGSEDGARTEFVYLLEWPDEATMKDRWAKFMADQEWSISRRRPPRSTASSSARSRTGLGSAAPSRSDTSSSFTSRPKTFAALRRCRAVSWRCADRGSIRLAAARVHALSHLVLGHARCAHRLSNCQARTRSTATVLVS